MMPDRLTATVKQTADALGLGESSVWLDIRAGRLETVAYGRRRLVLWDSVVRRVAELRAVGLGDARRNGAVPRAGTRRTAAAE